MATQKPDDYSIITVDLGDGIYTTELAKYSFDTPGTSFYLACAECIVKCIEIEVNNN